MMGSVNLEFLKLFLKESLENEVKILLFTPEDSQGAEDLENFLGEICKLSDKLSFEKLPLESRMARKIGVRIGPSLVFEDFPGVRFYGTPRGYEFKAFLEDLIDVSRGEASSLDGGIRSEVKKIERRLKIKVFSAPSCPYCPPMIRFAHQLAIINRKITSEAIDVLEFPREAEKYRVMAVPKMVINERLQLEGALPQGALWQKIKRLLG